MLATLAMFVCGLSLLAFKKRRQTNAMHVNGVQIRRDLKFFLVAYSMAALVALLPPDLTIFRWILGLSLIPLYIYYMWITLRSGPSNEGEDLKDLYCHKIVCKLIGKKKAPRRFVDPVTTEIDQVLRETEPRTWMILFQVFASLAGIILGSYVFVDQIQAIALEVNVNPLILAIVISPIATELPEKFNSMIWIRSKKDDYAMGNITGAMVFQSCIPVTIGLLLTSWSFDLSNKVSLLELLSVLMALFSGAVLYMRAGHNDLRVPGFMIGGLLYAGFISAVLLAF